MSQLLSLTKLAQKVGGEKRLAQWVKRGYLTPTATKLRMVRVTDKAVHIKADTVLDIHKFLKGQSNEDGVQH